MTTSGDRRGPSRLTIVALVILAVFLAILPALREAGAVKSGDAVSVDCGGPHWTDACRA